ncbi:MAG: hypothetical protein IPM85_17225 [Chitinophagaceae bacterium]|nr:hypothetical protein [Chitinophagaceae bacterium]
MLCNAAAGLLYNNCSKAAGEEIPVLPAGMIHKGQYLMVLHSACNKKKIRWFPSSHNLSAGADFLNDVMILSRIDPIVFEADING